MLEHGAGIEAKFHDVDAVSEVTAWPQTALHCAIAEGHLEAARILLEEGANPEATTYKGYRALHTAVMHRRGSDVRKLLHHRSNEILVSMM